MHIKADVEQQELKKEKNWWLYLVTFYKKYLKYLQNLSTFFILILLGISPRLIIVGTPCPLISAWGRGLNLQLNFQKRGFDRTSTFRGGLLGKRGVTKFSEGCNF